MSRDVLGFHEIDQTQVAIAGGKGAHLGALSRLEGVRVPAGFCVTTDAFRRIASNAALDDGLDPLSRLQPDDRDAIVALSAELRRRIEQAAVPEDLATAIAHALAQLGGQAYAVRSSATVEDLPSASFAGQQDTYLNIAPTAVLDHVRRCWASLFTERAVTYRLRNGFDHRKVLMAVVVQQMVFAQAAGILFTADPLTADRRVCSVEASFGLGEALVSGLVNADVYKVRDAAIIARTIATKQLAIHASPAGGTQTQAIEPAQQTQPALTEAQVVRLAQLGRRIEAHFGRPQDIEWCLVDDDFQIVQSRPITTLFPIPITGDDAKHVYISVGHQQMMTDPMSPMGLSLFQLIAARPMYTAGGRLFVDVAQNLSTLAGRAGLLGMIGRSDQLIGDALRILIERGDFPAETSVAAALPASASASLETDPRIVADLIERSEASLAALKRDIRALSGPALLDFVLADLQEMRRVLFEPRSHQAIMAGVEATWWLNDHLEAWLGEKNAADTLAQSAPHNVTSEMGLALLDVADAIRPHPEVVAFLEHVDHRRTTGRAADRQPNDERTSASFLDELATLPGGPEAHDAIRAYLDKYGMRCVGEIDIARPRWIEQAGVLVPILLGNIKNFEPGAGKRRFEQGWRAAAQRLQELLERVRILPDGEHKATEVQRMTDRLRTFVGYREYPKYSKISRYLVYKQALLAEAERLVHAGVLHAPDDIFYFALPELRDVVHTQHADANLIRQRRADFQAYRTFTPPRVFTSDGEIITGAYRRDDVPAGALVGLAVSAGTVEGRARVILDIAQANLEPGDILVTAFTDPSWTPLFVAIKGLVTEVGGVMTHGAVIAREYGLPSVVGVEHATQRIRDGQRIRVHGTAGYIELVDIDEHT